MSELARLDMREFFQQLHAAYGGWGPALLCCMDTPRAYGRINQDVITMASIIKSVIGRRVWTHERKPVRLAVEIRHGEFCPAHNGALRVAAARARKSYPQVGQIEFDDLDTAIIAHGIQDKWLPVVCEFARLAGFVPDGVLAEINRQTRAFDADALVSDILLIARRSSTPAQWARVVGKHIAVDLNAIAAISGYTRSEVRSVFTRSRICRKPAHTVRFDGQPRKAVLLDPAGCPDWMLEAVQ